MKVVDGAEASKDELTPIFGERGIPVAFFADRNYFPYVAVAVRSIVETASPEKAYDVLVFTDADVRPSIRERLLDETRGCPNVSLRLVVLSATDLADVSGLFAGALSAMTYGRLLLPTLLANYRRAIYLDVDIVVREDLGSLFEIDLQGNSVGAVGDGGIVRRPMTPRWRETILNVCPDFDFGPYVNAGVLLMDLDGLRRERSMPRCLDLAARNRFVFCDQDALNICLRNRILQLPRRWNQCTSALPYSAFDGAPDVLGTRTGIVHYNTGEKPWKRYRSDSPDWMWWDVASRTSYYQEFTLSLARATSSLFVHAKFVDLLRLWILLRDENRKARGKHPFLFLPASWLAEWREKLMRRGLLSRLSA